ncbi:hypothetical protein INR79_24385 [Vibrio sp. SCSIO 43132]|uniref:hypothetical protein n=1 Tax=Vibrio sp. SCSIO 43132 TaxID=2779363 RepID=UPI001CA7EC8E|nr:hypothetical protein [Vibrio sp. SCSIO 43132]UAB72397.1 hypothetical protein INR79_24385 [Vibrio sp. SCSIO 43132]
MRKTIFQTWHFRFFVSLPVIVGISIGLAVIHAEDLVFSFTGTKSIETFWRHMKFPIAVASLSLPIGAWIIANHRSKQTLAALDVQAKSLENQQRSIEHQTVTRLYDSYFERRDYFEYFFERRIELEQWKYIQSTDLKAIFSVLYGYHKITDIKEVKVDTTVIKKIRNVIEESRVQHFDIYEDLMGLKERDEFQSQLERYNKVIEVIEFFISNLNLLSSHYAFRLLHPESTSLGVALRGLIEVDLLLYQVEPYCDSDDFFIQHDQDLSMLQAILTLCNDFTDMDENMTVSNVRNQIEEYSAIRLFKPTLESFINDRFYNVCEELSENLLLNIEMSCTERYITLKFGAKYADFTLSFREIDTDQSSRVGEILLNNKHIVYVANDGDGFEIEGDPKDCLEKLRVIERAALIVANLQRKDRIDNACNLGIRNL